jgi:hypothetical protein
MFHTKATRRRLSEMRRGERNPFYGRTHSDETKAKMSLWTRQHNARRQYDLEPPRLRPLMAVEAAYLAGIVDGEGTIGFKRGRPFLSVYNTSLVLMRWLQALGGPGITARRTPIARKTCYGWTLAGARDLYILLNALVPFLQIKRQLALDVIAAFEAKYGDRING